MHVNPLFCFSGCGYLRSVIQRGRNVIASLQVITSYDVNTRNTDEVWLDCEVSDRKQQMRLYGLLDSVHAGASVIVTFKAEYGVFLNAFSGLTTEDPNHIITLQSRLRLLENCYVAGHLAETSDFHDQRAVA